MTEPLAFYCVADSRYFLGAVAMINSLRFHGHAEPVYLLDAGLEPWQRELLEPEARFVDPPYEPVLPNLLTTAAPVAHPAETMVMIDADMVVCRSLAEPIERAGRGHVVAFETAFERFLPEWGEILALGPLTPRPYVCAGLVLFGGERGRQVLELLDRLCAFIDLDFGSRDLPPYPSDYPLVALEQDGLNAILASTRVDPDTGVALRYELAPSQPYDGIRVTAGGDSCVGPDGRPYVLHHLAAKPWHERQPTSPYSVMLGRFLVGEDLAIRVPPKEVPVWLRGGPRGRLARLPVDARDRAGWIAREALPARLVARLDARRARRAASGG